jgi:anaerobic magnesium-protoporphyrin IX monomethyl ester cyclase
VEAAVLRIALLNAPLKSALCDYAIGHQLPLGMLMIGGPLLDAGHAVTLIDGAREHLSDAEIVRRVRAFGADVVMISHVGATQAHPCCVRVLRALKDAMPELLTVYGGVHATYHHKEILRDHPEVDVIVRGEGEAVVRDLAEALATQGKVPAGGSRDLSSNRGICWRRDGEAVVQPSQPTIEDLDSYRIGWELIEDWDRYRAFGYGRAAVVQFSRGCPHTCTYCGQWMFWKRWRHRNIVSFVDEIEMLHRRHGVRFFWLADENATTSKEIWGRVLEEVVRRGLDIRWSATMRAQDIVQHKDILHLYKRAGFVYILLGVETVTDENLDKIRKGSSVDDAFRAVRLLREHRIMSVVDYIFGIDDETPVTVWRGLRGLLAYDGDMVNALYITPHAWTPLGRAVKDAEMVEDDLWKWDYRHQVLGVKRLSPTQLFVGVKLVEALFHAHPKRVWRMIVTRDRDLRHMLRYGTLRSIPWVAFEVYEHFVDRLRRPRRRRCDSSAAVQPVSAADVSA